MSCKQTDFEIESGSYQVGKRRKLHNTTTSLLSHNVDHRDSELIDNSNDQQSMCETDFKGDIELVQHDADSCISHDVRMDIIPCDETVPPSADYRITIVDTCCDSVVTLHSLSGILNKDHHHQVQGGDDDVSTEINTSSASQSTSIVSDQLPLESPSSNHPSNKIFQQQSASIMEDENNAPTNFVQTNQDDHKEQKPQISMGIDVRRKLLVLDINGLLADVVSTSNVPDDYKADIIIGMKAGY